MKMILEKWKKINLVAKIFIICMLVIFILSIMVVWSNKRGSELIENELAETEKNSTEIIKDTYELNKAGFLKSSNILDEQFDEYGNPIYIKYSYGDEVEEDYYSYTYDDLGRITEIALKNGNNIKIGYSLENRIGNIVTTTSLSGGVSYISNYNFGYDLGNLMTTIEKVRSTYVNNQLYSKEVDHYTVIEKSVNGKSYIGVKEFDSNGQPKLIRIYNKKENVNGCSLKKLSMIPLNYLDSINIDSYINYIVPGVEFDGIVPVFDVEHMIYSYNYEKWDKTIIDYDEEGKELLKDSSSSDSNDYIYMSRYEKVNETTYIKYMLADLGVYYLASGADNRYILSKYKLYYNDNNEVCKIEQYEDENLSENKYISKKSEYETYINKNKVDVSQVLSAFGV